MVEMSEESLEWLEELVEYAWLVRDDLLALERALQFYDAIARGETSGSPAHRLEYALEEIGSELEKLREQAEQADGE